MATTPLVTTFTNQSIGVNKGKDVRNVGEESQLIQEETPVKDLKPQNVLKEVKKIVSQGGESGDLACFWLPNQTKWELLMCVDTKKMDSTLLFHYGVWDGIRQVKQVESISFASSPAMMKFTDGNSEKLTPTARLYLTTKSTLQRKRGTLIPKSQCKVTES
ncbi:hypothetical protein WEN_02995 [Mycoplasma wenyonii str. Massachusetts]|uniref:Uncharacterized protein n=1 Tax=Mycoplasma wenyonii (strain Massachusetts) TaxID=1197325 RepID=I6ZFJ0_MYCWM|nr:hypothetical protein [Mycoplasma wenyonii]AFN65382.1 hypothetical protein WEN_02995 [Mycoplasma wenyonii str. Massachusetts]